MYINQDMILQGDCLQIMPTLPDHSIDMVLCDLPYGITNNSWDTPIPLPDLWSQYRRLVKPNGAIVLFGVMPFTARLVASNERDFRYGTRRFLPVF